MQVACCDGLYIMFDFISRPKPFPCDKLARGLDQMCLSGGRGGGQCGRESLQLSHFQRLASLQRGILDKGAFSKVNRLWSNNDIHL